MITKLIYSVIYRRTFACIAFIGTLLMWGYFISLILLNDPRMVDNKLTFVEMRWWEHSIMWQGLTFMFTLFFSVLYHAFFLVRRRLWGVMVAFFWPLAFLYAWLFYPSEGKDEAEG